MYGGHAKTIKPDKRRLALLFDNPNVRYSFGYLYWLAFIFEVVHQTLKYLR
jgi:hypothetical protein